MAAKKKVHLTIVSDDSSDIPSGDLYSAITEAWNDRDTAFRDNWRNRAMNEDEHSIILTAAADTGAVFSGTVAQTEPGGYLRISQDVDGAELILAAVAPDDDTSPVKEVTHFAIEGNFVYVLQEGSGLRYRTVSRYLAFLLSSTVENADDFFLSLTNSIPLFPGAEEAIEPTTIVIKPDSAALRQLREINDREPNEDEELNTGLSSPLISILLNGVEDVGEETISENDLLDIKLELKIKSGGNLQNLDDFPFGNLAEEFGAGNVQVKGRHGQILAEYVKLSHTVSLEMFRSFIAANEIPRAFAESRNIFLEKGVDFG